MAPSTSRKLTDRADLVLRAIASVGATRAELVAWNAANNSTLEVGTVVHVDGLSYRYIGTGTAIADLPGWVPNGRIDVRHWGAVAYTTQGLAEAGTDSAGAFQDAVDYLVDNNLSAMIQTGPNAYRLASTVTIAKSSIGFEGDGMLESIFVIDHTSGPGLWFTRDNPILENLSVTGSTVRRAVSFASSGTMCGVRLEPEDAVDSTSMRLRETSFKNVSVSYHPSHGIVGVGALTGVFQNCIVSYNKGHGAAIAKDVYARTNATEVPGLCEFISGHMNNNGGHAICTAPLTDVSTPAARIGVINVEIGGNATDAAVRLWPSELYLRGSEITVNRCVLKPASNNTTIEAWYVSGVSIHITNNRYIFCTRAGTVGSHSLLQTKNVTIDGVQMISHPNNYDPLVQTRIETAASQPENVTIKNFSGGTIISLMNDDGSYTPSPQTATWLLASHGAPITFVKLTDQSVNNSTSMVDCADLELNVQSNEKVAFTATLSYVAQGAADIKVGMFGPTGSVLEFNTVSGAKVGTTDAFTVSSVTDQTSQITVGATSGATRTVTLVGTCLNSTTAGRLRVKFAQLVADVSDCTIKAGTSFITFHRIMN